MKNILILLTIMMISACNGNANSDREPRSVADPLAVSEFSIENNANYSVKVDCEFILSFECSEDEIIPGDTMTIGQFGDLGTMAPTPDFLFSRFMIKVDFGDGEYQDAIDVLTDDWEIIYDGGSYRMYSYSVLDENISINN